MSRCCANPSNHRGSTYAKGYTVCARCNRRYFLTDRGWQATPRCEPGHYELLMQDRMKKWGRT